MSNRGHYLGGHSLTFGSGHKDESEEYWTGAKARVDAVYERAQSLSADIRERLNVLDAQRMALRIGLRDGTISLASGEIRLGRLVAELEALKARAKDAGIKFTPDDGIGRALILANDLLAYVEMLGSWSDGEDLDVIQTYID
ncbi:hypothetical protein [Brevundimonas sp.]|uniref:hypothetical protein n=1 Tax=Brevundimonas sp. TaxID=1871086 RepID=UPI002FD8B968